MSELPARPDLGQLRRQARELLRAAADGEAPALTRIGKVSRRMSLSAAQLALAREYGFPSWPALHAEVDRRLAELAGRGEATTGAGTRWSFGGAAAVETSAGTLYPGGLFAGPGSATLDASLLPTGDAQRRLGLPLGDDTPRETWRASTPAVSALKDAAVAAATLTDDQGMTYGLHSTGFSLAPGERELSLRLAVDPVPSPDRRWLELRGRDGSTARLLPSARPGTRVSGLAPVPGSLAARELSELALALIGLKLTGEGQDAVERQCSAALARAAEIRQSGELGDPGDLPDQLARLCALLTGHGPADGVPLGWSSMLNAANATDGARQFLDIAAALPPVDDIVIRVDSLFSEPRNWKLCLRAEPSWRVYSPERQRTWDAMSVHAEDDLGGLYLSRYGSSSRHGDYDELALRFSPRLNPLARVLTLTFRRAGEQVTVGLRLP